MGELFVTSDGHIASIEGESFFLNNLLSTSELIFLRDLSLKLGGQWLREWLSGNNTKLLFRQFVGSVRLPSGRSLNIYPKLLNKEFTQETALEYQSHFSHYLNTCKALPSYRVDHALVTSALDVLEQHIYKICTTCRELLRRGLFGRLSREEVFSPSISGRINLTTQIKKSCFIFHKHHCHKNVFTKSHAVAIYIKTGLTFCRQISTDINNIKLLDRMLMHFSDTPTASCGMPLNRPTLNKMEKDWSLLIDLIEQILKKKFGALSSGSNIRGEFYLFETEKLFEKYVHQILLRVKDINSVQKKPSKFLGANAKGNVFKLTPDFIVSRGDTTILVDSKWKSTSKNTIKDVLLDDVRQMIVYQQIFNINKCILMFPSADSKVIADDLIYNSFGKQCLIRAVWIPIKLHNFKNFNVDFMTF